MSGWLRSNAGDPILRIDEPITISFEGRALAGIAGQTIAGVLLGNGVQAWRTDTAGRARGLFCGIGACFDCLASVNEEADVRLCRRRAADGDVVTRQTRSAR